VVVCGLREERVEKRVFYSRSARQTDRETNQPSWWAEFGGASQHCTAQKLVSSFALPGRKCQCLYVVCFVCLL